MSPPPDGRPSASPGTADRAATGEPWVDIRDVGGRLLRSGTRAQAEALVAADAFWYGKGRRAHVRLSVAMPPNSQVTWYGRSSVNPGKKVRYTEADLRVWMNAQVRCGSSQSLDRFNGCQATDAEPLHQGRSSVSDWGGRR